jgi:NADH-quinone oxidoreductase subunit M
MNVLIAPGWTWPAVLTSLAAALACRFLRRLSTQWSLAIVASLVISTLAVAGAVAIGTTGTSAAGAGLASPAAAALALAVVLLFLATPRSKLRRISASRLFLVLACSLSSLYAQSGWLLCGAMAISFVPPWFERRAAGPGSCVYAIHAISGAATLLLGYLAVATMPAGSGIQSIGFALLVIGLMIRGGLFPFHLWARDWFEHATLSTSAMLFAPIVSAAGVLLTHRMDAPVWAISVILVSSGWTVLYAGGLATTRTDTRLVLFGFSQLSSALVMLAAGLTGPLSAPATQSVWVGSVCVVMTLTMVVRAIESRIGPVTLDRHHGLFDQMPLLAIAFLVGGLSLIGFPGTVGFVGTEILIEGAVRCSAIFAGAVVLGLGLSGVAMMNAYLRLFTGIRWRSTIDISSRPGERVAVVGLTALILVFGIIPSTLMPAIGGRPHHHDLDEDCKLTTSGNSAFDSDTAKALNDTGAQAMASIGDQHGQHEQ